MLAILALVLAACDGGGTNPSANTPVIANLVAVLSQQHCFVDDLAGTDLVLSFDYTDADGNVAGGRVEVVTTLSGQSSTRTFTVPSNGVSLTGTTSGTIRVRVCVRFESAMRLTEKVALFDAANNRSNELSIRVDRPPGALARRKPTVTRVSQEAGMRARATAVAAP